jgi:AcrR family transcriptional regulator
MPARQRTAPRRRPGEVKSEATRRVLLERALALFQKHGVERTTMRDIAKAAGLSLGAAYYYFPSKEALIFAYYDANQRRLEDDTRELRGTVRERLGAVFHRKLDSISDQRAMLASIVGELTDPHDPLSAFSPNNHEVRLRSLRVFERALEGSGVPPDVRPLLVNALWLLMLASMLLFVHDDSPQQRRTRGLVDDGLDMLVPLLPLLGTAIGAGLLARISAALARAEIPLHDASALP